MHLETYSKPLLRISLSLVFLYFGYQQITAVDEWVGFVPDFALGFGVAAETLVMSNALLELVLGFFLLIGLYTRVVALVLALHLFGIALSIGFNPLGVRDLGLAFATLAIFLSGSDDYCLDRKFEKQHL